MHYSRSATSEHVVDDVVSRLQIRVYLAGLFFMLQGILLYFVPLLNWIVTSIALLWLFHRISTVLRKPVDELVKTLGIEVPLGPEASLSEIRSDGFVIHWKLAEQRVSLDKFLVQVNGITLGDVQHQECAAVVHGLQPGHFYAIRIVAVSTSGFLAISEVVRGKTSGDVETHSESSGDELGQTPETTPAKQLGPSVSSFRPHQEGAGVSIPAPSMSREHSSSQPQSRRGTVGKRSNASIADQHGISSITFENCQAEETMEQLTEKLECLRRAVIDTQTQVKEEEEDYMQYHATLLDKRELLRQQLKDRDDESKDLKRAVQTLERQNTTIQSKKAAQERLLQHKVGERQKMQEDMKRWDSDVLAIHDELKRKATKTQEYCDDTLRQVEEVHEQQYEVSQTTRALEEDIRIKGVQLKDMEDEKTRLDDDTTNTDPMRMRHLREVEEDKLWQEKLKALQAKYQNLSHEVMYAEWVYQQALNHLDGLRSASGHLPSAFPSDGLPMGLESPQNRYGPVSRNYMTSTSVITAQGLGVSETRSPAHTHLSRDPTTNNNPYTGSSFPFHEPGPLTRPIDRGSLGLPPSQVESLMNGVTTSPSAGALLPSGLFADEVEDSRNHGSEGESPQQRDGPPDVRARSQRNSVVQLGYNAMASNDVLPGLGTLPGLGSAEGQASSAHVPTSPGSFVSRSPSIISSPHDSTVNILHHHQPRNSIAFMDSDRRSIRSTSSASRNPRNSRFADLFSFRQRGKTVSADGPALGSLKTSQSQSMPRQTEYDQSSLEPLESSRRKAGNSSGLFGHISNALSRKTTATSKEADDEQNFTNEPRSMGLFSGLGVPDSIWQRSPVIGDRPISPVSTYSTEGVFYPDPDTSGGAWPSEVTSHRNNQLPGFFASNPWSAHPSRRQSVQNDTSDDLLHGVPDEDDPENPEFSIEDRSTAQAPIGTRPEDTRTSLAPKQLNPNARTFEIKNMFKKRERVTANPESGILSADDSSPPESRKSKEDRPRSAVNSLEEYPDAYSDSGITTPSELTPQTTPAGKESFIRKITRKGSSNKVNLPFFKDKAGKKGVEMEDTPDVTDEDTSGSLVLGKNAESMTSGPQVTPSNRSSVLSWSSFRKRTRKGNETPSIDESQTSDTGDEEGPD